MELDVWATGATILALAGDTIMARVVLDHHLGLQAHRATRRRGMRAPALAPHHADRYSLLIRSKLIPTLLIQPLHATIHMCEGRLKETEQRKDNEERLAKAKHKG
jgi:hypothetical protein